MDLVSPAQVDQLLRPQSQSSLELSRNRDGIYSWTTKKYQGSDLPDLEEVALYDDELKRRFTGGSAERGAP